MLVLSRKIGQSLVIDDNTVIRVLEVRGNQIRLGIEAPENVRVLRAELTGSCDEGARLTPALSR